MKFRTCICHDGPLMPRVPCSNARYCGNPAVTTRVLQDMDGHQCMVVEMCEPCAAEFDEVAG